MKALRIANPRGHGRAPAGTRAIVIGAGIAGLAAATAFVERGVAVTLVEREAYLGGRAGSVPERLVTGETVALERGFHAFFRQYYNLRNLLRRVDPSLSMLVPLPDYPILGPRGMLQRFADLPRRTPWQIVSLVAKSPYLGLRDLLKVNGRAALHMLAFDSTLTYAQFDGLSARAYLSSLKFPEQARRMLFDVFAHSFFNPEAEMSAAELLMMFHFYFTGNPEGLLFDVAQRPMSRALWEPLGAWLCDRGATLCLGSRADAIERRSKGGYRVHHGDAVAEGELLVLALDVSGLQQLLAQSPDLGALRPAVAGLRVTRPFGVQRLWLDRHVNADRPAFAGTTGVGLLDNISVYNHFQDESAAWSERHGGAVIELHAYGLPPDVSEAALREDLRTGLDTFYPEIKGARTIHERLSVARDCPAFPVGAHLTRPTVKTPLADVALAGDGIRVPLPCALMERAAVSGFLAANTLLARLGVAGEPLFSVPLRGLLRRPQLGRARLDMAALSAGLLAK